MVRRSTQRLFAAIALCAWVSGVLSPVVVARHDSLLADVDCGDVLLATPHPITQFESVLPPLGDGHCQTCHLLRAGRWSLAATTFAQTRSIDVEAPAVFVALTSPTAVSFGLASRAPPVSLS